MASGSHLDGGAYAAAAPVPGGPMADRRGLDATEIPVRLLLTEAPIFAPDWQWSSACVLGKAQVWSDAPSRRRSAP
jgi:hypothetical protein